MEFKVNKLKQSGKDYANSERMFSFDQEMELAKSQISQLKEDKKKLQEALRTVISERNKKSEKLKIVRLKYAQLSGYLKKEHDFIQGFRKDYEDLSRNREVFNQKSGLRQEIIKTFEVLEKLVKTCKVGLKIDEEIVFYLKSSVKNEKWDECCLKIFNASIKAAKQQQEFCEEDTPQFYKQNTDSKIDFFLENSRALLDSLSKQEEKLQKISEEYKKPKHMKTSSTIPSSLRIFTPTISGRNSRNSVGDIKNIETGKSLKWDKDLFVTSTKNRVIRSPD